MAPRCRRVAAAYTVVIVGILLLAASGWWDGLLGRGMVRLENVSGRALLCVDIHRIPARDWRITPYSMSDRIDTFVANQSLQSVTAKTCADLILKIAGSSLGQEYSIYIVGFAEISEVQALLAYIDTEVPFLMQVYREGRKGLMIMSGSAAARAVSSGASTCTQLKWLECVAQTIGGRVVWVKAATILAAGVYSVPNTMHVDVLSQSSWKSVDDGGSGTRSELKFKKQFGEGHPLVAQWWARSQANNFTHTSKVVPLALLQQSFVRKSGSIPGLPRWNGPQLWSGSRNKRHIDPDEATIDSNRDASLPIVGFMDSRKGTPLTNIPYHRHLSGMRDIVIVHAGPNDHSSALEVLHRTLRAVGSNAELVVFTVRNDLLKVINKLALTDTMITVLEPKAGESIISLTGSFLSVNRGTFQRAVICPLETAFQSDPFALADSARGKSNAITLFLGSSAASPSVALDSGTVGVCTETERATKKELNGKATRAIVIGTTDAVEAAFTLVKQWHTKVETQYTNSCTMDQILVRLLWAHKLAEITPVMVLPSGAGWLDLRELSDLKNKLKVVGDTLFSGDHAVAILVGYFKFLNVTPALRFQLKHATAPDIVTSKHFVVDPVSALDPFPGLDSLHVNYDICRAKLGTDPRPKLLKTLMWLHIPKCGTSLGTVVHGYLCQSEMSQYENPRPFARRADLAWHKACDICELERMKAKYTPQWDGQIMKLLPRPEDRKYCDWNVSFRGGFFGHNPLGRDHNFEKVQVIGLFRDPRRRAVSAWNHNKHTHHLGTNDATSRYPSNVSQPGTRLQLERATQTVGEFARHPHVQGCQTKMLIGGQCGMHEDLTPTKLTDASSKLYKLAFVGLTEYYNISVCLFHDMWGGDPQPHMFQNARPAKTHSDEWRPRKLPGGGLQLKPSAWKTLNPDDDPNDFALYLEARKIFVQRLHERGFL